MLTDFQLLLIVIILGAVLLYATSKTKNIQNDVEGFNNTEQNINRLNSTRGKDRQFYVHCKECNRRAKLLERNPYAFTRAKCDSCTWNEYQHNTRYNHPKIHPLLLNRKCVSCRDNIARDTVSIWNDDYIDTSQIFCYNCLSDEGLNKWNNELTTAELPAINGPPGYSIMHR
jgi:hypothetical protein